MARPVWTPTDAQRRQAETMAANGIPEVDIARVLGVSKPTLRKHCGIELDTGARRARLIAPRNSQDFAFCRRATSMPFSMAVSASLTAPAPASNASPLSHRAPL